MTYEQAIAALEAVVQKLENEQLPLDEVVKLYEQGSQLAQVCRTQLDAGTKRLQILMENAEGFARVEERDT